MKTTFKTSLAVAAVLVFAVAAGFTQQSSPSAPPVSGSGTTNFLPIWTNSTTLGTSTVSQSGGKVTVSSNLNLAAGKSLEISGTPFAFGNYANNNAFLGFAGNTTTTGLGNAASGYKALAANTTGFNNTAAGNQALLSNTSGTENTAVGEVALDQNTTGGDDTGIGVYALYFNSTGGGNTAVGAHALNQNTTGSMNSAIGQYAGFPADSSDITGSGNTFLGAGTIPSTGSLTNATAIGANAEVAQSNAMVLGSIAGVNNATVSTFVGIGTTTPSHVFTVGQNAGHAISDGWDTYSSRRWKTNIQTLQGALGKVERLRGVSYDLKDSGKHEVGVIAEEVGAVVPEIVSWDKNGKDAQGVDYSRLTALLIEATKEQQALIQQAQEQIRVQQASIGRLSSQMKVMKAALKAVGKPQSAVHSTSFPVHQ